MPENKKGQKNKKYGTIAFVLSLITGFIMFVFGFIISIVSLMKLALPGEEGLMVITIIISILIKILIFPPAIATIVLGIIQRTNKNIIFDPQQRKLAMRGIIIASICAGLVIIGEIIKQIITFTKI